MSTLTIRLPDDKHQRLRHLAKHRHTSVNKLIEELATIGIAEFDAETRFRALAAKGSVEEGIELLDRLDQSFEEGRSAGEGVEK
ncbi:MAG TPA: toxin-antitoxin system HicB family antitoxin [Bacteroidia bacterium]|nr:toxin-antitoxin system HicB family antitoxin [Bacteroidia bacterium]